MEILALYGLNFAFMFSDSKIDKQKKQIFSSSDSLILKGFFALLIIIHHIGCQFDFGDISYFNAKMGGVGVAVFFLLSAYGILKSCEKHDYNYLTRLVFVKLLKLYLFQVAVNFFYYLILTPAGSTTDLLIRILNLDVFFGLGRINDFSWFITTILLCYLGIALSLIIMKLFKIKKRKLFLGLSVIATTLIIGFCFYKFLVSNFYHRCIIGFIVGATLFIFEEKLIKLLSNKTVYVCLFIPLTLLSIFSLIWLNEETSALFVCLLLITAFKYVSLGENKIGSFLGKISLSIYLMQYMFFVFIPKNDILVYSFSIIGGTIVTAFIATIVLNFFVKALNYINNLIVKSKNKNNQIQT